MRHYLPLCLGLLAVACDKTPADGPAKPAPSTSIATTTATASAKPSAAPSASAAPSSSGSAAPEKKVEGWTIHAWKGTIGRDLAIDVYLERKGDELRGLYAPASGGAHVPLKGKMKSETKFALTELDEKGKAAGTFDGTYTFGLLKGTYVDAKKKKPQIFVTELHRSDLPASFDQSYVGTLGAGVRVRAKLHGGAGALKGVYRYAKSKNDLNLVGTVDHAAELALTETNKAGVETGRFEGFALSQGLLVGRWSSPDRSKTLPFLLESGSDYPETIDLGGGVRVAPQETYRELTKTCTSTRLMPSFEGAKGKGALDAAIKALVGAEVGKEGCDGATSELPYSFEDDYSIEKAKLPHVGVSFGTSSFTGGAHGSYAIVCKVANVETGELFSIAKRMTADDRKKLAALVEAALLKEHGVTKLEDAGLFVEHIELKDDAQVCVSPKGGIEVRFNPYEIGPWAMGAPAVRVADSDARPLLPAELQKTLVP